MQIDRMTLALRPRNAWEGVDLGAAMLRAWWRPLYVTLFCVMAPIALAAHLLLPSNFAALLVVWWLKPLYDRVLLHVMGSALFGAVPPVRATLASLPRLLRSTGLAGGLTLRRLDTARSFNLPVRQLEGQRGKAARERERLLGRRNGPQTSALIFCCVCFEVVVAMSLAALIELLTPAALDAQYGVGAFFVALLDLDGAGGFRLLDSVLMMAGIWAIEPLYVAGGFALYLNRRTALEAWDLELRFRRLRAQPVRARAQAAILACALVLGALALSPVPAVQAAEKSDRALIGEVLAAPEFQQYRTRTTWQPRRSERPAAADPSFLAELTRLLRSLSISAAQLLRLVVYAAAAFVLVLVIRFLWRQLCATRPRDLAAAAGAAPEVVFGLDVRPESLPADLAQLAATAAAADPRLALSLLYRGALVTLIHRDRLRIEHGDTEADCLDRVRRTGPAPLAEYFSALVAAWSQCAYGHRPPPAADVARLCGQWPQHFAPAPA
jgi:hypothetical protein